MAAFIGLLKYSEAEHRSVEDSLKTGRAARAAAEMDDGGVQFLSVLWADSEYDLVLILEGPDQEAVENVVKRIEDTEKATVEVMPAFVKWEKELLAQGKNL